MKNVLTHQQSAQWYDSHWWANSHRSYHSVYDLKTYFGQVPKSGRLLDVACGDGRFLECLPSSLELYGIDFSSQAIQLAQTRLKGKANLCVGVAESLPYPDDYFDYLICLGSIEHFLDLPKGLREMYRVGKPDCRYIITAQNSRFNIRCLYTGKLHTWQEENLEILHTAKEWKEIIEKTGFTVIKVCKDLVFKPKYLKLKRLIGKFIPMWFNDAFLFIALKKEDKVKQ